MVLVNSLRTTTSPISMVGGKKQHPRSDTSLTAIVGGKIRC